MSLTDNHIDSIQQGLLALVDGDEQWQIRELCAQAKANAQPVAWNLIDRALKMMQMAGYEIAPHNPDHNNPLIAWMSDARIYIEGVKQMNGHFSISKTGEIIDRDKEPLYAAPPALSDERVREIAQSKAMAQVCLDLHAALGVKWGDDPYAKIRELKERK